MEKDIRYVRSAIEDLAFTSRSSRESDKVGLRGCIEHEYNGVKYYIIPLKPDAKKVNQQKK